MREGEPSRGLDVMQFVRLRGPELVPYDQTVGGRASERQAKDEDN